MSSARPRILSNVFVERYCEVNNGIEELRFANSDPRDYAHRLSYWHLLGLRDAEPLRFSKTLYDRDNLTARQKEEVNAWLHQNSSLIWPELEGLRKTFSPVKGRDIPNPFDDWATRNVDPGGLVPQQVKSASDKQLKPEVTEDVVERWDSESEPPVDEFREEPVDGQKQILDAPLNSSMLVLAPPGTGKTHVLVERLAQLVASGTVTNPSNEILLLSFTRAAVAVMQERIIERIEAGAEDDLRYCGIRTFDSFATLRLLDDHDPEELSQLDYDGRIRRFNELLMKAPPSFDRALESLSRIRHLFVDEIQDLVGVRAEMVLSLVRLVLDQGGAVTVLGDPAQAIYDYQVRKSGGIDSRRFLECLWQSLQSAKDHREVHLSEFFRYSSPRLEEFVKHASQALGVYGTEPDGKKLESLLRDLECHHPEDVPELVKSGERIAILTRRNADVYQLAQWYTDIGLRPRVISSMRAPWPAWIARLTFEFMQDEMSRGLAERRFDALIGGLIGIEFDAAWQFLMEQGLADEDYFYVATATQHILQREPISTSTSPETAIAFDFVISNIHKSKGREFDRVLVLNPGMSSNWAGNPDEVRTYYVAATRAKHELAMLREDPRIIRRPKFGYSLTHDVIKVAQGPPQIIVQGDEDLQLGTMLQRNQSPDAVRGLQQALWESHAAGEVSSAIEFRRSSDDDETWLVLSEQANDHPRRICRASNALSADVGWAARRPDGENPDVRVAGFRQIELVTHAFQPDDPTARNCLGIGCLALVPKLSGMGAITPI